MSYYWLQPCAPRRACGERGRAGRRARRRGRPVAVRGRTGPARTLHVRVPPTRDTFLTDQRLGPRPSSVQRPAKVARTGPYRYGYGLRPTRVLRLRATDGAVRAAPTSLDACNELGSHQLPNTVLINFLQHASEHVAGMFADADRQQERTSIWRSLADHLDKRSCVHLKVLVIAAAHEHTGGVRAVCGIKRVVSLCGDLQKA